MANLRNDPISIAPPKVAKASTQVSLSLVLSPTNVANVNKWAFRETVWRPRLTTLFCLYSTVSARSKYIGNAGTSFDHLPGRPTCLAGPPAWPAHLPGRPTCLAGPPALPAHLPCRPHALPPTCLAAHMPALFCARCLPLLLQKQIFCPLVWLEQSLN